MFSLIRSSFKIALASIAVNKVRSVLTMLGIIIGVSAVIVLVSVGSGLRELTAGQFAGIGANLLMVVTGKVSSSNITSFASLTNSGKFKEEDIKTLSLLDGVEAVTADLDEYISVRYLDETKTAQVGGATYDYLTVFSWGIGEGRFFSKSEISSGKKVVIIGSKIKDDLFKSVNPLGLNLIVGQERYKIIGVLSPKGGFGQFDWDSTVYMPLTAAQRFFGRERIDMLYIKVRDAASMKTISAKAETVLLKRYDKDAFSIIEQSDLFKAADSIIGAITVALGGIASISLIVGGIGIMNIMLVTVTERTKEIGLRKALGARPRDILWQFLIEAVVLSGVGGLLGISLGYLGSYGLGKLLATDVTVWSVLLSFGVAAAVGIIFGIVPAYKASRLDPISALRYE
ncbi:MAG: ABC transporter permease [Patescibacteria group bacterium]